MAALTAIDSLSGLAGYVNACISSALRSFGVDYWPSHPADVGTSNGVALARHIAVAHPRAITAQADRTYRDDYYERTHITPGALSLGNLATAQTRTVTVWNAYLDRSLTLDAVQASNAGGMTVTPPAALPLTFAPLQQYSWSISVTPQGPALINAQLQWQFASSADDVTLTITGNRIVAWCFPPDWSQPINETLTWLTDVQPAVNGNQVRVPVREAPRRQWEWRLVAQGQNRRIVEQMLYDWSAQTWLVPVWPDITLLAAELPSGSISIPVATANLDFTVGGLAMLWSSPTAFEIVEISAIAANALTLAEPTVGDWPVGARLYPCRLGTLTDYPQVPRSSSSLITGQVRFQAAEPCDWPATAPATTYLGLPVLEQRTDEPTDLKANYSRIITTVDNDIGTPVIDDPSGQPWTTQEHRWRLYGQADRTAFRSLLYWLAGRANALWLPSWTDDVLLTAALAGNAASLTVEWAGIARYGSLQAGRRHLRIELNNGSVFYRTVNSATETGMSSEQLAIDSPLGVSVQPGDVRQISWMMLATQAVDGVQILHEADSLGLATSATTFVGVPMEEP